MTETSSARRPALAATLSFVFPGLGQAYMGQRRLAIVLAGPIVLIGAGMALVLVVFGADLRNDLFSSTFLTALIVLDGALLAWRLYAIAQVGFSRTAPAPAGGVAPVTRRGSPASAAVVVILLILTAGMHAWAGSTIRSLDDTLGEVFSAGWRGLPDEGGAGDAPLNLPEYAWDGTERISFLLLGVDSGPGREASLTDTILVVSVDPAARTAVMVSVPRDTGFVPLPDRSVYADGVYPKKINALASEAAENAELWCPDLPAASSELCGIRSLQRAVGLYLGIPLQYYASVDLLGFTDLIDAVGGVRLCLPGRLVDTTYDGPGWPGRGVDLAAGCTRYDGQHALAYARVRKGSLQMPNGSMEEQNDFLRAERQQHVLLELRREFARLDLIFELPPVLRAVGRTVSTDFPRGRAGDLASLLPLITGPDIERVVLGYPEFVDPPIAPTVNYLLIPRREDVRAEMERLFGAGTLEGWYVAGEQDGPPS
jgi:LCP family protein required for cell wall assembly